jgi:hypothetical protein
VGGRVEERSGTNTCRYVPLVLTYRFREALYRHMYIEKHLQEHEHANLQEIGDPRRTLIFHSLFPFPFEHTVHL